MLVHAWQREQGNNVVSLERLVVRACPAMSKEMEDEFSGRSKAASGRQWKKWVG